MNQAHSFLHVLAGAPVFNRTKPGGPSLTTFVVLLSLVGALTILCVWYFHILPYVEKEARQKKEVRAREEWMDQLQRTPSLEKLKPRDRNRLVCDLSNEHPQVRRPAAKLLRQKGGAEAVRQACDQFSLGRHPDRVADAILAAQWSEMEPALLRLIERPDKIGLIAIKTLAEIGGTTSLKALLAQAATPALKPACDLAILRLRERLRDCLGGRDAEGRVSLASDGDQIGALGFPQADLGKAKQ